MGRKRNLAYSEDIIIWRIRDLRRWDKSNQNTETMKRQAIHVLLTNRMH